MRMCRLISIGGDRILDALLQHFRPGVSGEIDVLRAHAVAGTSRAQWQVHMAVFWHDGPPEGHSSPAMQMASLSPQFTEQPPQAPRGLEGGALQELTCPSRSEPDGPLPAVWEGPVSLEGAACEPFSSTHAANERATSTAAASEAPETMREERVRTITY